MSRYPDKLVTAVTGVLLLVPAKPALAFVVSQDPLENKSLAVGGSVRTYNLVLEGGPLSSPFVSSADNPSSVSTVALRPFFELKGPTLEFIVHDELTSTASTLPRDQVGSALALGTGSEAPAWLPLQWTAADGSRYQLRNRVDWMFARYMVGAFSFTLGRQPVTIGRGQIWTPEDLLVPFSPLQLNREYKPGIDALRVDWSPSEHTTLLAVGTIGKRDPENDFAVGRDGSAVLARFELSLDALRLGALVAAVRGDAVGGLDLFLDLGHGTDLHGSGTVTYVPQSERRSQGRKAFARVVLGTTTQPTSGLLVTGELYFNGSGAANESGYLAELSSERFKVGEEYNVGRAYAGVAVDWEVHPLLHALGSAIVNVMDPSAIFAPELHFNVAQNALLVAGAFLPVGRQSDYGAMSVIPRSEFGLYPRMAHLDAKLYF